MDQFWHYFRLFLLATGAHYVFSWLLGAVFLRAILGYGPGVDVSALAVMFKVVQPFMISLNGDRSFWISVSGESSFWLSSHGGNHTTFIAREWFKSNSIWITMPATSLLWGVGTCFIARLNVARKSKSPVETHEPGMNPPEHVCARPCHWPLGESSRKFCYRRTSFFMWTNEMTRIFLPGKRMVILIAFLHFGMFLVFSISVAHIPNENPAESVPMLDAFAGHFYVFMFPLLLLEKVFVAFGLVLPGILVPPLLVLPSLFWGFAVAIILRFPFGVVSVYKLSRKLSA